MEGGIGVVYDISLKFLVRHGGDIVTLVVDKQRNRVIRQIPLKSTIRLSEAAHKIDSTA
ncbi:MAG: flagellar protein FlaG [bacterium]|nr:flagellar protein FlaG [bacterium]